MFHLDQAIEQWCDSLEICNEDRESHIDELKDHLYREIKKQQVLGLTEEEAFTVATGKLGDPKTLQAEYQKVENGSFIGQVVEGLSSKAIRLSASGSTVALESSLRVPFKTLLSALIPFLLIAGVSIAAYIASSRIVVLVQVIFLLAVFIFIMYEHWRGRTFLEITPHSIRQQFRLGPFTLSDNIYATEFISELEAKRMLPGFDFGVCRVQFRYGSRIRAFNVGYYIDEANYIIEKICEAVPELREKENALAMTNARSNLSNFVFAILALVPVVVYWRMGAVASSIENYYDQRPLQDVPYSTELFLSWQPWLPWLLGYALLCTVPFFLLIARQIKPAKLVRNLERLIVVNGAVNWLISIVGGILLLLPRF